MCARPGTLRAGAARLRRVRCPENGPEFGATDTCDLPRMVPPLNLEMLRFRLRHPAKLHRAVPEGDDEILEQYSPELLSTGSGAANSATIGRCAPTFDPSWPGFARTKVGRRCAKIGPNWCHFERSLPELRLAWPGVGQNSELGPLLAKYPPGVAQSWGVIWAFGRFWPGPHGTAATHWIAAAPGSLQQFEIASAHGAAITRAIATAHRTPQPHEIAATHRMATTDGVDGAHGIDGICAVAATNEIPSTHGNAGVHRIACKRFNS